MRVRMHVFFACKDRRCAIHCARVHAICLHVKTVGAQFIAPGHPSFLHVKTVGAQFIAPEPQPNLKCIIHYASTAFFQGARRNELRNYGGIFMGSTAQ